ncbi:hypothetical protein HQ865_19725 [Mucilaginibacter mali]|uniref:KAP NTPase domain-containing protein n=1 Tax=Mucilaginibacter mali TaxID=2740462 RepID=A0A7D4UCP7_9SPHI|nr:P-loop NTPase fold protein [Mucilaginibacter mali]QKJ31898.1 hypothetical protein HQ865_19725 [Mucilaginibacter mali]
MKRNFIVDQEIQLLKSTDFLNTKVYADTLSKMIINTPKGSPFTIGLFGEWGSGKSSIIKTTKESLEGSQTFKTKFALFDAWKYSEDAFRRSFIISLSKELNVELNKREYNLYANHVQQIEEFKITIPRWLKVIGVTIPIILIVCYIAVPWVKANVLSLVSLLTLYIFSSAVFLSLKKIIDKDLLTKALSFVQSLIHTKYNEERPLMFSPEQFSRAFDYIVEKSTTDIDKLVIVIDNIDRCEKHYATELLSTIKGFLESNGKVLFILPVDETSLKRHLREAFKADDREADEFLRKFFNTTLKIKPYQTAEIYVFAKEVNKKFALNFSDYTLDLVSKEYASNPRRIIQMFNNLSAELECYPDDTFTKQYETLICKLLIAREEFPRYYTLLSKNPYLINMDEGIFNNLHPGIWNKSLGNFLRKTSVISETVDIKIISQILSNSIVFNALPSEIEGYINNLEIDEINKFINGDTEKLSIVTDYLIQQLDTYKERNLIGNVFINSLDILMFLESEKLLSRTINMRIEEIIKSSLNEIFELKKDLSDILTYAVNIQEQGRSYITGNFLLMLDGKFEIEKPLQKWLDALESAIKIYQDEKTLMRLADNFKKAYEISPGYLDRNWSSEKIASLVNDNLYEFIIQNLTTLSNEDTYFSDLKFILEHHQPSEKITKSALNQVNQLYPDFTNKDVPEITTVIENINSLLSVLNTDLSSSNELRSISNLISSSRAIHNPTYPNHRQYDTMHNYVSETISAQSDIDLLLRFYFNIYRLSLGQIDILPFLNQVVAVMIYQEQLNNKLIELINSKHDIKPLFGVIIKDSSYTDNSFKLLEAVFTETANSVTDEQKDGKLIEILNLIENNDGHKEAMINFLETISSNDKTKDSLSALISAKNKASILKLSKKLQSLAIDKVLDGERIFDFSNNIDFLKVIAETGSKSHIAKLVKDIISKLQHKDQHSNAISIIREIKNISKTESNRIIHELENQSIESISKEEINEIINNLKAIAKA